MSSIQNASNAYQNNQVLEQSRLLRESMNSGMENIDSTKVVDTAEKADSSTQESVKVELSININGDSKSVDFMNTLKSALQEISTNQSASQSNNEKLNTLNDIKSTLQQSQIDGLFGNISTVSSFGDITDKLNNLNKNDSTDNGNSSSTVEQLGLGDLEKALSDDGSGITIDNVNDFIQDLTTAIETVTKQKETNDKTVLDQNSRVLEESKKLRESMGYDDAKLAEMQQIDMEKESQNFTKQNVTSQAGSLVQSQSANANTVNKNVM